MIYGKKAMAIEVKGMAGILILIRGQVDIVMIPVPIEDMNLITQIVVMMIDGAIAIIEEMIIDHIETIDVRIMTITIMDEDLESRIDIFDLTNMFF